MSNDNENVPVFFTTPAGTRTDVTKTVKWDNGKTIIQGQPE